MMQMTCTTLTIVQPRHRCQQLTRVNVKMKRAAAPRRTTQMIILNRALWPFELQNSLVGFEKPRSSEHVPKIPKKETCFYHFLSAKTLPFDQGTSREQLQLHHLSAMGCKKPRGSSSALSRLGQAATAEICNKFLQLAGLLRVHHQYKDLKLAKEIKSKKSNQLLQ